MPDITRRSAAAEPHRVVPLTRRTLAYAGAAVLLVMLAMTASSFVLERSSPRLGDSSTAKRTVSRHAQPDAAHPVSARPEAAVAGELLPRAGVDAEADEHAVLEPSFFVLGQMKCGTSALYVYLLDHPGILPAKSKEPAFWQRRKVQTIDGAARLIDDEYRRKFFPPLAVQVPTQVCTPWLERDESGIIYEAESLCKERLPGRHYIVGDHTAAVLSQGSPAVLHHWYPHARLVVLVRDPSQRVLSHYRYVRACDARARVMRRALQLCWFAR